MGSLDIFAFLDIKYLIKIPLHSAKKIRLLLSILFLLSLYTENGRSGQLAFILIFLSFSILTFWQKKSLIFISILSLVLINLTAYFLSPHFKNRIDSILVQLSQLEKNKLNSLNTRYYLFSYSYEKLKEKPWNRFSLQ